MDGLNEIECGQLCSTASSSLSRTEFGLSNFPKLLKKIIQFRAWEKRRLVTPDGRHIGGVIELQGLRELIATKPLDGWGEDPKKVEALIKDDPECLTMYREAMKATRGPKPEDGFCNNVTEIGQPKATTGNSKAYTLSRLEHEAPELFKDVCDGKTTANAAAIKAGFRQKTVTVCATDVDRAVTTLLKHYSREELIEALGEKV